jgi:hypothetical protein
MSTFVVNRVKNIVENCLKLAFVAGKVSTIVAIKVSQKTIKVVRMTPPPKLYAPTHFHPYSGDRETDGDGPLEGRHP